jgi:hypothetical protein
MLINAVEFSLKIANLPTVMLCGDGSKILKSVWNKYANLKIAPADWDRPLGSAAARIGCQEFKFQNSNIQQLIPCYLRKVEAEERLEERECNQKSKQCELKI